MHAETWEGFIARGADPKRGNVVVNNEAADRHGGPIITSQNTLNHLKIRSEGLLSPHVSDIPQAHDV